jgi:hypothetical protein
MEPGDGIAGRNTRAAGTHRPCRSNAISVRRGRVEGDKAKGGSDCGCSSAPTAATGTCCKQPQRGGSDRYIATHVQFTQPCSAHTPHDSVTRFSSASRARCQRLGGRVQHPIRLVPRIEAPLPAVRRATAAATNRGIFRTELAKFHRRSRPAHRRHIKNRAISRGRSWDARIASCLSTWRASTCFEQLSFRSC